ncbi:MAG: hypothetical protein HOQ09_03405 [Gemmatimonadaceae bacterium]|nr:hypothetical protein [Gemmatimonadaceae bacterium]
MTIALAAGVAVAACKDNPTAAPIDAPTVTAIKTLTPTTLQQLATGVTAQDRASYATTAVLTLTEILARDVYRIDASEPRYVNETLGGQADPGSFAGGGGFAGFYTATRAAQNAIDALKTASSAYFSPTDVKISTGFFRTMKALDFYRVIELRDTVGIPLQTANPMELTPIYCKPHVLNYIAALLDSGYADLTSVTKADTLPFKLPGGFSSYGLNYNVDSNLVLFNRGLKGKVDFYRAIDRTSPQPSLLPTAISELTAALGGKGPGAVTGADLQKGIYYRFDPVVDQISNLRSDAKIAANPHIADSIPTSDARRSKLVARSPLQGQGLSSSWTFSFSVPSGTNQVLPIALLKNEELVLLRAQAEIEAGQFANALADINAVHLTYNSTPVAPAATVDAYRAAVLYEKRFSLLFEGPQRLVDLRAYGYLNAAHFVQELSSDPFNNAFPIPRAELNARHLTTNPACTP